MLGGLIKEIFVNFCVRNLGLIGKSYSDAKVNIKVNINVREEGKGEKRGVGPMMIV